MLLRLLKTLALRRRRTAPDARALQSFLEWGSAALKEGRPDEAAAWSRQALDLAPDSAEALHGLSVALIVCGRKDEALEACQRLVRLEPQKAAGYVNLGAACRMVGKMDEAIAALFTACRLEPDNADAQGNLAVLLQDVGRHAEAEMAFRKALAQDPSRPKLHSALLLSLNYRADLSCAEVFAEHRRWASLHADRLGVGAAPHANIRDPERRLRIGFVSADFKRHSVAYFIESVFAALPRDRLESVCYSDVSAPDEVTARLRTHAREWHDVFGLADEQLAAAIRSHGIDILVDLAGHTGKHRLLAFARRPAPVQVTWIGYPNTTGMQAMDYRLTDAWADPPGETERYHSESLVRLASGFLCYTPPRDAPEPGPSPIAHEGAATFGCFNNYAKLSPPLLDVWVRLLTELPKARLLLKARGFASAGARAQALERFRQHGIDDRRIEILPPATSLREHLATYRRVDVALDVFPYNGATTTCEALWMGVPVVTLAGRVHASRVGGSLLCRSGLSELVADTPEDYVTRALGLVAAPARLGDLRRSLRDRLLASPLLDARPIACELEAAFRGMWHTWCAGAADKIRQT